MSTLNRKSLLQELVEEKGTEGKNVKYIDTALDNGGGFGATAMGTYSSNLVDDKYINTFLSDSRKFLEDADRDYNSLGFNTASTIYSSHFDRIRDLRKRYSAISQYMRENQNSYDAKVYDAFVSELKNYRDAFDGYQSIFKSNKDYYSQWSSEEEYETARAKWQDYYDRWGHYADEADYDEWSSKGAGIVNPTVEDAENAGYFFGKRIGGADVGNVVTYSRDNWEKLAMGEANGSRLQGRSLYHYMTDDEVGIYNYLLAKQGSEAAQSFLDDIEEDLNYRMGSGQAERFMGIDNDVARTAALGLYGLGAGVDQWASGARQFVTNEELPTSAAQFGSSQIANSLDGFGKYAYQAATTIGNMAPSILVSSVFGAAGASTQVAQIAGAATMGTSAAGNAYGQALDDGYSEGQARAYSTLVGASEGSLQYLMGGISKLGGVSGKVAGKIATIDNALLRVAAKFGSSIGSEIAEEELQAFLEPAFRSIIFGEDYDAPTIEEMIETAIVTALSTGALEGGGIVGGDVQEGKYYRDIYGGSIEELVAEGLDIDPQNAYAQKLQSRLDSGKNVSGHQMMNLVQQNEAGMVQQDMANIQSAATARLTELGETGDVHAIGAALAKQAAGQKLTRAERQTIAGSKYGQRVSNELNAENVRTGEFSSEWAGRIGTDRIHADEYNAIVEAAQIAQESAEATEDTVVAPTLKAAQESAQEPVAAKTAAPTANRPVEAVEVAEESPVTAEPETEEKTVTIEEASEKYGAQAGAMLHTYQAGQDVEKYDAAYQHAYNMGKSGVSLSYVMESEATAYLTEKQREFAYEAGKAASDTAAGARAGEIKAAANGKTGRVKGTVKGVGVTIADIKKTFNDTQGKAYKYLSTVAEVTGVNIVLYKSEANAEGKFTEAQGKYRHSEPGTLYIDINAGLANVSNADDLAKYAMLRTFAHEFTHFIENWNPVQYNEFRRVVFDTLTQRGENVNDLIEEKMAGGGLSYEAASREVVAEAMTDILPDANFVQELAEKHKSIFTKLLEKLKEFVENLREYFTSIGHNRSREANALKEQVGETVKYLDSIVKLFDNVAVQAVENYQATIAIDEVTGEVKIVEEPVAVLSGKDITRAGDTITIGDPATATREVDITLTDEEWETVKQLVPQKKAEAKEAVEEAPAEAPEQSDFEKAFWSATQAERDEVVDAIHENTKISHMAPTEIHGAAKTTPETTETTEEVTENVENADIPEAVQLPAPDREGNARLLDEVENGDVPGDGQRGDTVGSAGKRSRKTGRDDVRSGVGESSVGGHGEGDRPSGDIRRDDGLTVEEPAAEEPVSGEPAAERLHEEVVEQIAQQSTELPKGRNFVIGDSLDLPSGEKARYKANIEAIKLVKKLEAEGRYATEAEQVILSKYVGWGGLANAFDERKADWAKENKELKELLTDEEYNLARGSTLNAHYTDISVIKAMYDGLSRLGFTGGRMLEPSSGVGNFVGAMPAEMSAKVKSWTMVELDGITGLIAKYLYPNADVRIQGFETANIPNNYMDVAISNVPFGNYPITDKTYPKKVTSAIHNYFFAKSLDKVRPGGIVMFITSSYTMNSKDTTVRRYIMQHADLLGAIRLPDTAFKGNAGTEVVTDILILKKREANTNYAGVDFLEAPYQSISGWRGANVNTYFQEHPEMVLGAPSMEGSMYRGDSLTYKAFTDRGSLADQIREAFSHIEGKMDYPAKTSPERANFAVERADKKTKKNGLVAKNGKIYKNENGQLIEQNVAKGVAERITGLLEIRDAARELHTYLQQGLKESEIKKARTKLNGLYDAFVKKHGFLNAPANRSAISDDPDKFSILALENWNPETKTATKADIFSKNTIAPNRTVTSAKDVAEGLIVSRNETGGVDTALIARLTGKTDDAVTRELIDTRLAFKTRDGELEAAEVYLSGNVRAKLRDAEALVPLDSDYANNVDALKAIVPEDVSYEDIFVNPGTPWIPDSVYSDFAAYMLGSYNTDWRPVVIVKRSNDTGNFTVELKEPRLKHNSYNTQKWGTPRRSFLVLFDAMLNSRSVVVKYKTDDGQTVVDKDATAAANEKMENITREFQEWLWKDEARRGELVTLYNETFNAIVTPKYNGDNLTVNGANAMKPLRPHQRDAVQRVISSGGNTLLAHKVGAGKTYEMAAAAMKLKQLGLVRKPMFAVPKSLVAQWGQEFMDFFPTARLLVAEASDFTAANRKIFANRIANGNYDAVIVSYEQFEKLPMSDEFTRVLYQEQIDSIVRAIEEAKAESGGKSLSVKDLEKKRKSLQAKIDKLTDKAKDEDNIEFEQLGVDSLFIDEAHNFKNLFYTTSMTNVSGLGNKDGSKRAFDLYTKVRYLQQLNGGRGIVFATATPVMNSMSEMYIMQKYLQPDLLDQLGLSTFDAWAKQFGEVVNGVEIKPSGQGYRVKQSFSRFKNMSELQLLFRNFADVLTEIPGLKIPKMKGGKVSVIVCEPGQFQQDYMQELEKRADNIKNVDPSVDNMLKITSDGRKISYTQRMIDPSLPYEEGCKIFRCADNVARVYKDSKAVKGTQLIFCDMATPKGKSKTAATETEEAETDMESAKLYEDIKARLVKSGIPAKEIAFIHEADTDAKKKKLFADVNDGKVRVLIGSTGKMGVGMNAQKRVVAIHHLDAPWRPGDVEQRNGRAFRQGNINDEVECFTYVTEGSFDARLWDILERKQNFINQVMNGENVGREAEDTGEVTLSAAEVKALASGSPLIMEQVQLETDIKKLESLRRAHVAGLAAARTKMEKDKTTIASYEKRITAGKADLASRVDTYSEGRFSITVGKKKYTEKKDAGVALMAEATAKATEDGYTTIGSFAGFELRVVKTHEGIKGLIVGRQGYNFNTYPGNTTYMVNHLISIVEGMSGSVELWEQNLSETRKDLAEQEKLAETPFAKQEELEKKRSRYNEVMAILNPKEEQSLDSIDEGAEQHQSREYLEEESEYDGAGVQSVSAEEREVSGGNLRISLDAGTDRGSSAVRTGGKAFAGLRGSEKRRLTELVRKTAYSSDNFQEVRLTVASYLHKKPHEMTKVDWDTAYSIFTEVFYDAIQTKSVAEVENLYSYITEDISSLIRSIRPDAYGDIQFQQRTDTLTDREVLEMAADNVKVSDLTDGEQDALRIFRERLAKLRGLQEKREELGRTYKDQQFGTNVDRKAAAETLNRMHILDDQIKAASAAVLSVEDKTVLKRVLQKARKVVEQQEREHGKEILNRWRERRNNAAAVKKYRDRIRADVDELTNWVLHPDNKNVVKHIPDALKSSVVPFLSSINFMSKQSLRGGNATAADKAFMEQLRRLAKVMENTADIDEMYSNYTDLPPDFMKNLRTFIDTAQEIMNNSTGEFIINQMTAEELQQLSKLVRTLKKYIMQMNRFHVNAMFQHVYEAGDNTIDYLAELKPAEHTGTVSEFVLWQQIRPAYAFERFGDGGMAIYEGLRRGQATLAFNTEKIKAFAEKAYTPAEVNAWEDKVKTIRLGPGRSVKMRVSQIMSLYELSKRPQALGHILGEGIRVSTFKDGKKKISDVGQTLTPGEMNLILKELTPRQMEVADALQQFMEKQGGEWGNHVTVARFGERQFGEEHYFPINSDGRHLSVDADEHPSAASLYALLNMGFTKQTQEKAKNRIIVYSIFDVFANHMASMAQYNAFALPVVDALKWFNYQRIAVDEDGSKTILGSVREQMDRAYGVPEESRPGSGRRGYAQNFVINIIKAFNGTEAQGSPNDGFMLQTLHRYNMAQVAYNLRVVVQQPLAITRAALLLDYGSILKGMKLNPATIKKNIGEMRKYSGIAAWKGLGFYDINISRGLTEIIKHDTSVMDRVGDFGMKGAELADTVTWAAIWSASKEEVIRKQKLKPGSEGFYEAVTKLFEDVIYKTQVVDSVLTKNEYMRDKGFGARMVSSFMSEPTTTASMLIDAYDKFSADRQRGMSFQRAWKKNGNRIARVTVVYAIGQMLVAAVQAVADAWRDDDDYQTFVEKVLEAFTGNLWDELAPLNKLPIVSDLYEVLKELAAALGYDTYGSAQTTAIGQVTEYLSSAFEIMHDLIAGEKTNYTWYGGIYKLLQAVSGATGIPLATFTREVAAMWNNTVGAMAPSLKLKTYEPSEQAQIKYAFQDGYLTELEAARELLAQGLVDNEDEAYWLMQGWEAGEGYSRYDALHTAARSGGSIDAAVDELTAHGYTEKEVITHLKGKIGEWYKNGEITKTQATNMLTKYADMDSEDITEKVNEWTAVVVTGIELSDVKDEYIAGNITDSQAKSMRMLYGGDTEEEAAEKVNEWTSEKETGIAFSDIKDAFMDGEITEENATDMYIRYGGYTEAEAAEKVTVMAFVKEHPDCDGISLAAIENYTDYCEAAGVPAGTFYDAWKFNSSTHADVDANGEAISGSKKVKVLAYINTLDLTYDQKDSLYYAFGWAASRIYEAPWH